MTRNIYCVHYPAISPQTKIVKNSTSHAMPTIDLYVYIYIYTWWLIPLSKWLITPIISGLILLIHTYPIFNWGCKPLTKWDEPPSIYIYILYICMFSHLVFQEFFFHIWNRFFPIDSQVSAPKTLAFLPQVRSR